MKLGKLLIRGLTKKRTPRKVRSRGVFKAKQGRFFLSPHRSEQSESKDMTVASVNHAILEASAIVVEKMPEILTAEKSHRENTVQEPAKGLSAAEFIRPGDRLRQSIEAFLLDLRSPHTRRAYGKDLERFMKYLIVRKGRRGADDGPENLNRAVLIGYKDFLLAEKLQHTTIDRHLATLKSFFRWLVDDGILEKNPTDGVRFLNPKKLSTTNAFTDDEVVKLLKGPNLHTRTGSQHYAILMILFYCGLRRSELCEIKNANLGIERDLPVVRLRGKGNAERVIVLIPPVWSALKHYLLITRRDIAKDGFLFSPIRNNRTGVKEKGLDPSMIFYLVKKYAKLAGIMNRVSPHSCRATAISNARDHNVPDRAIQEFAGWSTPDMITRYDKRKAAVENSAARAIRYGVTEREIPAVVPGREAET